VVGQISLGILTFWFVSWELAPVVVEAFAGLVVGHIVGPELAVGRIEVEPVGIVAMVGPQIVVQHKPVVVAHELEL